MLKFGTVGIFLAIALVSTSRLCAIEHTKDSLDTVRERVATKKAILVDVRDLVEWEAGHIKGALQLPYRELQDKYDEAKLREKIPKDTIVYTYCVVGMRSLKAGSILEKAKYDVRPLKQGYEELLKAGFEKETKK